MKFIVALIISAIASPMLFADKKSPAYPYQKPGAAIHLASPDAVELDPFSSATVAVVFATRNTGQLKIVAKAKEGIEVTTAESEMNFDLTLGQARMDLTFETGDVGEYHVMFHATIDEGGSKSSRVFGLPVYVGEREIWEKPEKSHPQFIIMKGRETIR